jgi:hypothetical protein
MQHTVAYIIFNVETSKNNIAKRINTTMVNQ